MSCISCNREIPGDTWEPGMWCLFGVLVACSYACCETFARDNAAAGYRPGEPGFKAYEPNPSPPPADGGG